ncbi:MAG: hypothetical protein R3E44_01225 [Paracoccaceae bacterium]
MGPLARFLLLPAARHGRALLILGLVAGIMLPGLAAAMKPYLQELVALLLFLAALRIGPRQAAGSAAALGPTLRVVLIYQLVLPLIAVGVLSAFGIAQTAVAMAVILVLSASPIAGSPNLAILSGADPVPAFRLLIIGTALLPLTVVPVFWLMPGFGHGTEVIGAAGRLLAVIALAALAAFALRLTVFRDPRPMAIAALDGLSAIVMAIVVVGLMAAVGPALASSPTVLLGWFLCASATNLGLQIVAGLVLGRLGGGRTLPATAIVAGNRNIALFLVALPVELTDRLLMFIGCYQIPMYLTPILLGGFFRRTSGSGRSSAA